MVNRTVVLWLVVGWVGYVILPWYAIEDGFFSIGWLSTYIVDVEHAPGLFAGLMGGRPWLLPIIPFLLAPLLVMRRPKMDPLFSTVLLATGGLGLAYVLAQGFAVSLAGWNFPFLESWFGPIEVQQFGMGYGALLVSSAFVFFLSQGIAARGAINGDVFVVGSITMIIVLVAAFIFFPVVRILISAVQDNDGNFVPMLFVEKLFSRDLWGVACLTSTVHCGIAWNSLVLAIAVGVSTAALGLAFALVMVRTRFRAKIILRVLTVLPIITPPFVIALAIILIFGRSGAVSAFLEWAFGIEAGRWIYGFIGVWLSQVLAYTPISFLVLIGVVEGISPAMEEAAQTLRAGRWQTFMTVSLPLIRPGLANAFLIGFIESMADFGNPMVLGGDFEVLSTSTFFAIVGAQNDQGRAAVLAIVLLCFTLSAFYAQRFWLGRKSYTTVTGKGDSGVHPDLPRGLTWLVYGTAIPWAILTFIIYAMIMFGGFVKLWGYDHSFTLQHYIDAFGITWSKHGIIWAGAAWNSFSTTILLSLVSTLPTAGIGLLTAYLLVRQRFRGHDAFEFGTMLSFAIPGTVIGIAYILAFNVPPIELTGTGAILVLCFVFRNMPVGVRAGVAAMSQIDQSLDESSLTLGATSFTTLRRVVLPLLRPAIVAALVFSFVRAMTAISAVIFLVSARYDMATSYIIGRVENGDFGLAISYSSVLIVVMVAVILGVQFLVGERKIGRRGLAKAKEGRPAMGVGIT